MNPAPLNRQTLGAWLHLASAPGLTTAAGEALLRAFDSIDALFGADHAALAAIAGEAAAQAVLAPRRQPDDALDAVLDWLARSGGHVITRHDPAYPPRLATLYDPPPLLYVKGDPARLHRRGVAIVGSRLGTAQGRIDAVHFARVLADAGLVVVSGLARGIDAAAHRGALGGAAGTVAVVGTGLDRVYPAAHHALAHEIVEHGALLSEWSLGTPARAANFPQRNRLIAALCDGVLVVEAAPRSGSLITARVANEMGRDVFAIPGSIHAPLARGCHALIRDGAKLVETPADVLEEFGIEVAGDAAAPPRELKPPRRARRSAGATPEPDASGPPNRSAAARPPEPLPAAALAILEALGHGPVPADLLAARSGVSASRLPHLLLQLELAGRVASLPGDRFQRLDAPAAADAAAAPFARPVLHSGDRAQSAPSSPSKEPQCPR
ncbi:DNA-processing protein DprA [Burkholderia sp. 22PA0106]|uniref:DNA-processing protein DprA n=1 Tax=Burkholderia sp. 22PA0106 TaxID=3237371 RepID=UPI0039C34A7F